MKVCSDCKQLKSLDLFSPDRRRSDNKQSRCRPCGYSLKKEKRLENKQKAVQYKGRKCNRCNLFFECLDVYDFHHRDPKQKEESLNKLMNSNWDKIVPELDKCDLLCSNCHKLTHWELRNFKEQ
jgi:ferric iron reductase protein FhuF